MNIYKHEIIIFIIISFIFLICGVVAHLLRKSLLQRIHDSKELFVETCSGHAADCASVSLKVKCADDAIGIFGILETERFLLVKNVLPETKLRARYNTNTKQLFITDMDYINQFSYDRYSFLVIGLLLYIHCGLVMMFRCGILLGGTPEISWFAIGVEVLLMLVTLLAYSVVTVQIYFYDWHSYVEVFGVETEATVCKDAKAMRKHKLLVLFRDQNNSQCESSTFTTFLLKPLKAKDSIKIRYIKTEDEYLAQVIDSRYNSPKLDKLLTFWRLLKVFWICIFILFVATLLMWG